VTLNIEDLRPGTVIQFYRAHYTGVEAEVVAVKATTSELRNLSRTKGPQSKRWTVRNHNLTTHATIVKQPRDAAPALQAAIHEADEALQQAQQRQEEHAMAEQTSREDEQARIHAEAQKYSPERAQGIAPEERTSLRQRDIQILETYIPAFENTNSHTEATQAVLNRWAPFVSKRMVDFATAPYLQAHPETIALAEGDDAINELRQVALYLARYVETDPELSWPKLVNKARKELQP